MAVFEAGGNPMAAAVPMQPSFEDRADVSDTVFASLGPNDYERQVHAWANQLQRITPPDHNHAHHLTHVNNAIHSLGASPVVVQLHGTELKMTATIADGARAPGSMQRQRRFRLTGWHSGEDGSSKSHSDGTQQANRARFGTPTPTSNAISITPIRELGFQ